MCDAREAALKLSKVRNRKMKQQKTPTLTAASLSSK